MIIVRLIGGLGNQMFEYATAYAMAKYYQTELKIDNLYFRDTSKRFHLFTYRPYALSLFNITAKVANDEEIAQFTPPRNCNKYWYFIKKKLSREKNILHERDINSYERMISLPPPINFYLDGLFQKYEYFGNILPDIRTEFTFKEPLLDTHKEIAKQINGSNSVCICFRRGDYVGHPFLDIVSLEYYYNALKILEKQEPEISVFVFSDDIPWCMNNFKPRKCTPRFISQNYTGELAGNYFQLMMLCKHFIIPNSTYPYWAALLSEASPNKKVIAPHIWYKGGQEKSVCLPPEWITI